jgi:hypothetical protein
MILIAVVGCLLFCEIKLSVDIFPALSKAPGNELFVTNLSEILFIQVLVL